MNKIISIDINAFYITPNCKMRLKQYGLNPGQIFDLATEYNSIRDDLIRNIDPILTEEINEISRYFSEEDFIKFCLTNKREVILKRFSLDSDWKPLNETVANLNQRGISIEKTINEYLPMFIVDFKNQFLGQYSTDYYFIKECHSYWSIDIDNPNSKTPRRIQSNWVPSDKAIQELNLKGINHERIRSEILEYRLYWTESGGMKTDWDKHFISWYCRKEGIENLGN